MEFEEFDKVNESQPAGGGGGVREREGNEGFEKQGGGWDRRHFFVLR